LNQDPKNFVCDCASNGYTFAYVVSVPASTAVIEPFLQCCGSMTFWCGSGPGSADPCLWLTDPDADIQHCIPASAGPGRTTTYFCLMCLRFCRYINLPYVDISCANHRHRVSGCGTSWIFVVNVGASPAWWCDWAVPASAGPEVQLRQGHLQEVLR